MKYEKEEYFKRTRRIEEKLRKEDLWGMMLIESTYPYADTIAADYYPQGRS